MVRNFYFQNFVLYFQFFIWQENCLFFMTEHILNDDFDSQSSVSYLLKIGCSWSKMPHFGMLFLKIGMYPEALVDVCCRICFLVLSKVMPMEVMRRSEQASFPSHCSPKHPLRSKQNVGWLAVGLSDWQQLKWNEIMSMNWTQCFGNYRNFIPTNDYLYKCEINVYILRDLLLISRNVFQVRPE